METRRNDAQPVTDPPFRVGMPWDETDLHNLVTAVAQTDDPQVIARRIGRSAPTLSQRCIPLLPPEERHIPKETVIGRLHELLQDRSYDWREQMLRPLPPPQVTEIVENRVGWQGLADEDLLRVARVLTRTPSRPGSAENASLLESLRDRGLAQRITSLHIDALVDAGWPLEDAWTATRLWLQHEVFDGDAYRTAAVCGDIEHDVYDAIAMTEYRH